VTAGTVFQDTRSRHSLLNVEQTGSTSDDAMTRLCAVDTRNLLPEGGGQHPYQVILDAAEQMLVAAKQVQHGTAFNPGEHRDSGDRVEFERHMCPAGHEG
jgi:hypothetical protein